MPFPATALRSQALPALDTVLAFFIYVVVGPVAGLIAFSLYAGGLGPWLGLGSAYLFGLGPAATCAVLSLQAARRLRTPLHRLAVAPLIGALSGAVGLVPAYCLVFGVSFRPGEAWFLELVFGFSTVLSIFAAILCTAFIEAVKAVLR
jgi:hypothetical protein